MGLLSWIIVGGLAGWLAKKFMGGSYGLLANIIIGIIGAFVGGFVFSLFGSTGVTGLNLWSILVALVGSCILIWISRKVKV